VLALLVFITLVPSPWVRPTYGFAPILSFENESKFSNLKIPLNHFQIIGTHNSVHVAGLFSIFIPYWRYTHTSLANQLNIGVRHIELDLWFNKSIQKWEIWHESIDRLTVTPLFLSDVLSHLMSWSKSHNNHFPLTFNLDIKGSYYAGTSYFTPWLLGRGFSPNATKYDKYVFEMLEREILDIWHLPSLFTPASMLLETKSKCVRDAIENFGWPTVEQLRGKSMFQLNLNGKKRVAMSKDN